MRRNKQDLCMLCEKEKATKKNSHIVSKFIGKSILGNQGSGKGYTLDSSKPYSKPRKHQDSPKEDFILCPKCEKYFEQLETYIAEHLSKRILTVKFIENFDYKTSEGGIEYVICKNLNPKILRLFVFSLFWRCSISSEDVFAPFLIKEESRLKEILTSSIGDNIPSILKEKCHTELFEFPIVIMKAKDDHDNTENFLYANAGNDHFYQLILNDYIFFFSLKLNSDLRNFSFLNNIGDFNVLIGLLLNKSWIGLRDGLIQLAAKKTRENVTKMKGKDVI